MSSWLQCVGEGSRLALKSNSDLVQQAALHHHHCTLNHSDTRAFSHTRTVYSIILDLITVSSGFYFTESAEFG